MKNSLILPTTTILLIYSLQHWFFFSREVRLESRNVINSKSPHFHTQIKYAIDAIYIILRYFNYFNIQPS